MPLYYSSSFREEVFQSVEMDKLDSPAEVDSKFKEEETSAAPTLVETPEETKLDTNSMPETEKVAESAPENQFPNASGDPVEVTWDGEDDPQNPKNWPKWKKW